MLPTPPSPLRHLGLDLGEKRIGVAISDLLSHGAQPLALIERASDKQAIEEIARIIDEYEIQVCVAGLPLNMDGSEGRQAQRARSFIGRLRKARPVVAYEFWDERLTTFAADEAMAAREMKPAKRERLRDQLAAMIILEEYLRRG